jgi:TetR/AcrR family transcriptional regulator, lmrAB and yxaGH operons repressor
MPRLINERADAVAALREVFREHGYEGASLSLIERRTGLGKGSLYHFFPGGKEEMALAVLNDIDAWFELHMFAPLREAADAPAAIGAMFRTCIDYFHSGERICLLGIFALCDMRDRFPVPIDAYFSAWESALASALRRCAKARREANSLAQDVVAGIQGALVISRSHNNVIIFKRLLNSLEKRIKT